MSQFDKLLQRIRSLDRNLRFDELQKVLEHYGYTMSGPAGGSTSSASLFHLLTVLSPSPPYRILPILPVYLLHHLRQLVIPFLLLQICCILPQVQLSEAAIVEI